MLQSLSIQSNRSEVKSSLTHSDLSTHCQQWVETNQDKQPLSPVTWTNHQFKPCTRVLTNIITQSILTTKQTIYKQKCYSICINKSGTLVLNWKTKKKPPNIVLKISRKLPNGHKNGPRESKRKLKKKRNNLLLKTQVKLTLKDTLVKLYKNLSTKIFWQFLEVWSQPNPSEQI